MRVINIIGFNFSFNVEGTKWTVPYDGRAYYIPDESINLPIGHAFKIVEMPLPKPIVPTGITEVTLDITDVDKDVFTIQRPDGKIEKIELKERKSGEYKEVLNGPNKPFIFEGVEYESRLEFVKGLQKKGMFRKDIAKILGVSPRTVENILYNDKHKNQKTRKRKKQLEKINQGKKLAGIKIAEEKRQELLNKEAKVKGEFIVGKLIEEGKKTEEIEKEKLDMSFTDGRNLEEFEGGEEKKMVDSQLHGGGVGVVEKF
jgi:hypothetical protein